MRFCINRVTGPDEYTTVVDNNLYTNLMAAENLRSPRASSSGSRATTPSAYERARRAAPASATTRSTKWRRPPS